MIIPRGVDIGELSAREVLDAVHAAWSREDIEGVLNCFVDDLYYWSNTSALYGQPLAIIGKDGFRAFLHSMDAVERLSVRDYFRLADGVGRATIEVFVKHKRTGHTLSGSFRQVISFRGGRISRLEEFHDAAMVAAFWRLVSGEAAFAPALGATKG